MGVAQMENYLAGGRKRALLQNFETFDRIPGIRLPMNTWNGIFTSRLLLW